MLSISSHTHTHTHTHPHTHIYIYIYIYILGDPKQKSRIHIFLNEIHKFNASFFFFSGYEVDSVHEKLGPWYSPTCPEVRVYKIRILLLYFGRSINKFYGFCFFFFGHPIYIYIYIYWLISLTYYSIKCTQYQLKRAYIIVFRQ